jgi:hypothetical protein
MNSLAMTLTPRALLRLFPNASKSCLAANRHSGKPQDYAPGVCNAEPQRDEAETLERGDQGKEESPGRAHVRIKRFGTRLLDDDNLRGGAKPLIDCLKEAGLIHDDSPKWIDLDVTQEQVPAGYERTEVEITWL